MKIPAPDRRIQILKKKNNPNKKIREKNKSVASALSVIDFERGERAEGERAQKESCLEDSTERSESNPGRSLGIIDMKKSCLEDSTMTSISIRVNP